MFRKAHYIFLAGLLLFALVAAGQLISFASSHYGIRFGRPFAFFGPTGSGGKYAPLRPASSFDLIVHRLRVSGVFLFVLFM